MEGGLDDGFHRSIKVSERIDGFEESAYPPPSVLGFRFRVLHCDGPDHHISCVSYT